MCECVRYCKLIYMIWLSLCEIYLVIYCFIVSDSWQLFPHTNLQTADIVSTLTMLVFYSSLHCADSAVVLLLLCLRRHRWGHYALMVVVRLSVSLVPDPKSRTERRSKLKIGTKEACDTIDSWPHLEVRRPKVKVTRLINVVTENQP